MKKHSLLPLLPVLLLWVLLTAAALCKEETELSTTERRKLAVFPTATVENYLSGRFSSQFEEASTDQFPLREPFRTLNALRATLLYGQGDSHDIYERDGYLEKLDYPLSSDSVSHAAEAVTALKDAYLQDSPLYFAVVPDKNYFLAASNGLPSYSYDVLLAQLQAALPDFQFVDLTPSLTLDDYYRTDSHWRQERLGDTTAMLARAMGVSLSGSYEQELVLEEFRGVYAGQSALPVPGEPMYALKNAVLEGCTVTNLETGETGGLWDPEKLQGRDPYEFYLSGAVSLLRIENPAAAPGTELIVFRDSFGSSLIPLLCEAYETVTVIDTRYCSPNLLPQYLDFHGQPALFLYGTALLGHSAVLRT